MSNEQRYTEFLPIQHVTILFAGKQPGGQGKNMAKVILIFVLSLFSSSTWSETKFRFIGHSSEREFKEIYGRAFHRVLTFYHNGKWQTKVLLPQLIQEVEVYSSKSSFDAKFMESSNGKLSSIPKTYLGVADKKTLRVVSWPVYKTVHPNHSKLDYEKLLSHEIAHQLHIALLGGDEDAMGPLWFFEGFAVVAANQYEDAKAPDLEKLKAVILNPARGKYEDYGALVRKLNRTYSLSTLVDMAKKPDFSDIALRFVDGD